MAVCDIRPDFEWETEPPTLLYREGEPVKVEVDPEPPVPVYRPETKNDRVAEEMWMWESERQNRPGAGAYYQNIAYGFCLNCGHPLCGFGMEVVCDQCQAHFE